MLFKTNLYYIVVKHKYILY